MFNTLTNHVPHVYVDMAPISSAAELATIILAATFPTMPRLWIYIRTGDRNGQRYTSSERRSAALSLRKPRPPVTVEHSTTSDILPLKGRYQELQDGKRTTTEELEMQIMKTETYEVTSQPAESAAGDLLSREGSRAERKLGPARSATPSKA